MSAISDAGAEREIDLSRWKQAAVERWWIVAAGLVAGVVVGALYSLSGGSVWEASVLVAPGQPFTPSGSPVLSYQSSPRSNGLPRRRRSRRASSGVTSAPRASQPASGRPRAAGRT